MKGLVLRDDHCRLRLMQQGLLGAAAIGTTAFLLNASGFRTPLVFLMAPALGVALVGSGLVLWIELRARARLLRRLIDTGIRVPVTLSDVVWSDDSESPWGNGVWAYAYNGHHFEIHAFESLWVRVRTEATALVDPDRPERAVLVMANGFTRGGYRLSEGSRLRRTVLPIVLLATWAVWVLAIGIALTR